MIVRSARMGRPPCERLQRDRGRRDGHVRPGRRHEHRGRVGDLGDDVHAAGESFGVDFASVVEELDRGDPRRRAVDVRADPAGAKRIQVKTVSAVALREMDVCAAALVDDMAEELVEADDLVVANGRLDVPVAECAR